MIARAPSAQPASDEEVVRVLTVMTVAFCGALALVLLIGVTFLFPDRVVTARGAGIGLALGLVSWYASRWMVGRAIARAGRRAAGDPSAPGIVRSAVFVGIACAESPALTGLAIAVVLGNDIGPFVVAIPMAIAAIVVNVSGPGAVRGHLESLRG